MKLTMETPVAPSTIGSAVGLVVLDTPQNIKILTTGDAGETLLNVGPANGKHWMVDIRVMVIETDV